MAPSIVLFVAARKGNQQKQKSTLKACDPVVTLRQLAASILGPDAEVGCVEAAATLGGETTNFTVDDLGYTAHFLQECGLRFIQIVFVERFNGERFNVERFNGLLMSKSKAINT